MADRALEAGRVEPRAGATLAASQVRRRQAADRECFDEHAPAKILLMAVGATAGDRDVLAARKRFGVRRNRQRRFADLDVLGEQRIAAPVNEPQRRDKHDDERDQNFEQYAQDFHDFPDYAKKRCGTKDCVTARPESSMVRSGRNCEPGRCMPVGPAFPCRGRTRTLDQFGAIMADDREHAFVEARVGRNESAHDLGRAERRRRLRRGQ
jgi:hypothetical protein